MRAGGSKMRAAAQQHRSSVTLARSRFSIPDSSRQARDTRLISAPPGTYCARMARSSPRSLARVGQGDTPQHEHTQTQTQVQGRAGDENEFHGSSLPPDVVRGLPDAQSQPEERSPEVKHKSRAPRSRAVR
jgi:hypothetical protein